MRQNRKVVVTGGAAAVVLAAGSTLAMAAAGTGSGLSSPWQRFSSASGQTSCTAPALSGTVVDVTLGDMGGSMMGSGTGSRWRGGMMGGGYGGMGYGGMMSVQANPVNVPAGTVSLRVTNDGALTHELVVLPLTGGDQPGQRSVAADGRVSESSSLGEASNNCGADEGDGIRPGATGWTTLDLAAGRYELICNLPGHYGAGMYTELDVTPTATP